MVQDSVIVRFHDNLIFLDAAQHAIGALQLGLLFFLVAARDGNAYAAVARRILARILAGKRGLQHDQRESKPIGTKNRHRFPRLYDVSWMMDVPGGRTVTVQAAAAVSQGSYKLLFNPYRAMKASFQLG